MISTFTSPSYVNRVKESWQPGYGVTQSGGAGSPTLYFDFLTGVLNPAITFTRASTATFFNSAGVLTSAATNAPRFDYNPSTLAAQGLLIEESRTNICLQSENFGTTWIISGMLAFGSGSTLNATTSPDGTQSADLLTENTATSEHRVDSAIFTWAASTTYTFTLFAKPNGRTRLDFFGVGGGNFSGGRNASFNLATGAVIGTDGTTASITAISNGWYRLRMTFVTSAAPSPSQLYIRFLDNSNNFSYTGDGTSGIYLWGAQIEAGAFPTSYIPTTTTALTRAADVASVNTLSPWYNASAGTLYVQGILVGGTAATFPNQTALVGSNVNTDSIAIAWTANSGNMRFGARVGGVSQADIPMAPAKVAGNTIKVAGRYANNDFQAASDGNLGTPDTTGSLPTITALSLGGPVSFQPGASVWLQRVTYYPRIFSNAELQAITA